MGGVLGAFALTGAHTKTRIVYRPATPAMAAAARDYARELAAYRVAVERDCLPVLHEFRHGELPVKVRLTVKGGKTWTQG
jgi:hypothetical protein